MVSERPANAGPDDGRSPAHDADRSSEADGPSRRTLLSTVAAVGAGLAGCTDPGDDDGLYDGEVGDVARSVAAAPVVLPPVVQQVLGLPDFEVIELSRTVSPPEGDDVGATSYLTVHERPREADLSLPTRFGIADPGARSFGMLSVASAERVGAAVDPMATEPLAEVLAGDRGKRFLQRAGAVESADFDWVQQPRQLDARGVELLGTATEGATVLGIAALGEGSPTTILMNLARVPYRGDVVVAAELLRRRTPPGPVDDVPGCVDDLCQLLDPEEVALWREYQKAMKAARVCEEVPIQGTVVEVCPQPDGGSSTFDPPEETPTFEIGDPRVVQHVEDTVVKTSNRLPDHREDDPPLVDGERSAVVFEFDTVENVDAMDQPLTVEIYTEVEDEAFTFDLEGSFDLTQEHVRAIATGEPTLSVLHRLSNDGDDDGVPVFELESDQVRISPDTGVDQLEWDTSGVSYGFAVTDIEEVDPLTVGFIAVRDYPPGGKDPGDRYGDEHGLPQAYPRTVASVSEYLERVYPGNVVSYAEHDVATQGKGGFLCVNDCAIKRDLKRAKRAMEQIATDSSYPPNGRGFPDGGTLRTDGLDRDRMVDEIESDAFDVVVAVVPDVATGNGDADGYFDYWGSPDSGGKAPQSSASAVAVEGASPSGDDQAVSFAAAHEVGHYFQDDYAGPSGHPMAQRRGEDGADAEVDGEHVDFYHARHQGSDVDDDGDVDPPGVVSTAFDLEEDGFDVLRQFENPSGAFETIGPSSGGDSVPKVESFMSYTDARHEAWTDARLHHQFIDSGWQAPGTSGGGDVRELVSGDGSVGDDGELRFDEVTAFRGVDEYTDSENHPVLVELLGPDGEVLEAARVPFGPDLHDGERPGTGDGAGASDAAEERTAAGEPVPAPAFRLPFHEAGVRVRATYEDRTTELNPVERSVRDAVDRVPPEGFAGDPATARDEIGDALDAVAALMAEGAYQDAAAVMDSRVKAAIEEHLVPYEATLGEPTPGTLTDLADEMSRRVESVEGGGDATGPVLELPDGTTRCVEPVESEGSAAEYYGFDREGIMSSNTLDGLETDDATVAFVHRDATTGDRSLVVVHGDPGGTTGDGGTAVMTFDGVEGATWQVQDGPPRNDAYETADGEVGSTESVAWSWPDDRSDGGVLGPLGDAPSVGITHLAEGTVNGESFRRSGLDRWLFVDGADVGNPVEVANFVDEVDGDVAIRLFAGECYTNGQ